MLFYILLLLPALLLFQFTVWLRHRKSKTKWNPGHAAGVIIFGLILVGLVSLAIIPRFSHEATGFKMILEGGGAMHINLIPLRVLLDAYRTAVVDGYPSYVISEIGGNVALFALIGLMLPLLWQRFEQPRSTLLWCLAVVVTLELIQLFLGRVTDVDDVLVAMLGALIGHRLYRLLIPKWPVLIKLR